MYMVGGPRLASYRNVKSNSHLFWFCHYTTLGDWLNKKLTPHCHSMDCILFQLYSIDNHLVIIKSYLRAVGYKVSYLRSFCNDTTSCFVIPSFVLANKIFISKGIEVCYLHLWLVSWLIIPPPPFLLFGKEI